jgi:acetylornithine deacetylase/succinyl-diaminopimelate desuccinylase-like protein
MNASICDALLKEFFQFPMKSQPEESHFYAARAMEHLAHLAHEIGARPSTQDGEKRAAEYSQCELSASGLRDVRVENFRSARSTYRPYLLAFGVALLGNAIYFLRPNRKTAIVSALAHFAAAWGFAGESSLKDNWTRRVLPKAESQNVIGIAPAREKVLRRVVVYGHLDSHRTPLVYSSPRWLNTFSKLVTLGFASLVVGGSTPILAARDEKFAKNKTLRVLNVLGTIAQAACAALLIEADTTPYSPGANDNASGAATVLALAQRTAKNPLRNTEVWFVGTGCEEVGCYGIAALLDAHGEILRDAFFVDFDMVGIGNPAILTREGLLLPSRPNEELLELARKVAAQNPELEIQEHDGGAYTDTGMVTSRGFAGLTIDSIIPEHHPAKARAGFWHQRDDVTENIEIECLRKTHEFGWKLLELMDEIDGPGA